MDCNFFKHFSFSFWSISIWSSWGFVDRGVDDKIGEGGFLRIGDWDWEKDEMNKSDLIFSFNFIDFDNNFSTFLSNSILFLKT